MLASYDGLTIIHYMCVGAMYLVSKQEEVNSNFVLKCSREICWKALKPRRPIRLDRNGRKKGVDVEEESCSRL